MPDNIDNEQTFSGESLKGNSLDVKIGYDKRAAAKRDLAVVLQDVEGSQLTDAAGNELISEIEGFVTSELTSEKAVSVVAPTETRTVSNFYTIVFGSHGVKAEVVLKTFFPNKFCSMCLLYRDDMRSNMYSSPSDLLHTSYTLCPELVASAFQRFVSKGLKKNTLSANI